MCGVCCVFVELSLNSVSSCGVRFVKLLPQQRRHLETDIEIMARTVNGAAAAGYTPTNADGSTRKNCLFFADQHMTKEFANDSVELPMKPDNICEVYHSKENIDESKRVDTKFLWSSKDLSKILGPNLGPN